MNLKWLIPQEKKFFDMLEEYAEMARRCCNKFVELFADFERREEIWREIKAIEHEGDELQHMIVDELNTTFVTPIDRDDIHKLASGMDDILDFCEGAAQRVILFKVEKPAPMLVSLADVLFEASKELASAMPILRNMSKWETLKKHYVEIHRLENRGDEIMRAALVDMFETMDAVEIIKTKEICEYVEEAIDRNEDVAVILESLIVKHA
jgi:uncharacterized protein